MQAVVETIQGERGAFSSIKHINPTGGGQRQEKADAKGLAAKYGAKTRALFGGVPSAPAARALSPRPSPLKGEREERGGKTPPPPPTPPFDSAQGKPAAVAPSTMEECWEQFCQVNASKTELELYDLWPKFVKEVTGKTQMEVTPQGWGNVRDSIGGMLPY